MVDEATPKAIERLQELAKREWYIQRFNGVPLLIDFAMEGGTRDLWKALGYGYEVFVVVFKEGSCEYYYDVKSLRSLYKRILEELDKDPAYLEKTIDHSHKEWARVEEITREIPSLDLTKMTDEALRSTTHELLQRYRLTASIAHLVEAFSLCSDITIKEQLAARLQELGRSKELATLLSRLTTPVIPSFLSQAEQRLLRVVQHIKERKIDIDANPEEIEEEVEAFLKEFSWVRASYTAAPALTKEAVLNEIKERMDQHQEEKTLSNEKRVEIMHELGLPDDLQRLILLAVKMTTWQDDRKKIILQTVTHIDKLLKELSKRYDLPLDLFRQLFPAEITAETLASITKEELEARKKGMIKYITQDERVIIKDSFPEAEKTLLEAHNHEIMKELTGITASVGRVVGKVALCQSVEAIATFPAGAVMVTSMTRPEYLPAMKKAVAIVTDEGGLTCHAAIISRELGIPCVIGTKVATKTLKNGDLVDVKAYHGEVQLIERRAEPDGNHIL